ncbi:MAG: YggS family pyridoxal phosphate-dependent enzyme [Bacteroidota bacterium]
MSIAQNLQAIEAELRPNPCQLIAVSKTKPVEAVSEAYEAGHRDFGENKVQELVGKEEVLPKDIRWHMIGHLQRNKVKYIAPFVHLIHGIDTKKLLIEVNKQGQKNDRVIQCLLQIHIAQESTKFGFDQQEVQAFLDSETFAGLTNVKVCGLMGMATLTDDQDQIKQEFRSLKALYDQIDAHYDAPNIEMKTLSMGMSGDYKLALEEGSTMIRVGTAIFGARNYPTQNQ